MSKINEISKKQDKELVELLISGSQEALGELYARYRNPLMNFCKKYMRNEADAEDLIQDVFLQLWEKRHSLDTVSSFAGYVQTMTRTKYSTRFDNLTFTRVLSVICSPMAKIR